MAVIINDFEIISPSPESDEASNPSVDRPERTQQAGSAQMLAPADIECILRHLLQRRLRLWAD